ncbi:MAG: Gx transporter family protein [Eubacteriales bacterium]|nr:Gx transporter family protein [Eubacteriales bacterium]
MRQSRRIALCAVMISAALALSYIERFIPLQMIVPLPGIKLGLANIVTLIALYTLDFSSAMVILVLRCLLGSLFGGGVTALMFSLTGGVLSVLCMGAAKKAPFLSIYGVSILGAAAHGVGQIAVAMCMMRSVYIGAYLPWLLCTALATGTATGAAGAGVLRALPHRRAL